MLGLTSSIYFYSQKKTISEVLAIQHAYCKAVEQKDSVYLGKLFHDNMTITSGSGERRDKRGEIRDALNPNYEVQYFRTRETEVKLYEGTAIVLGDLYWKMTANGNEYMNERRYTFVYVMTNGDWKIVAQHIGPVP